VTSESLGVVDQELLDILVCPETRQPLRRAGQDILDRLNIAAAAGTLVNRAGTRVAGPVLEGLVREDGLVLYPVREDIPIMLVDEAIPLASGSAPR